MQRAPYAAFDLNAGYGKFVVYRNPGEWLLNVLMRENRGAVRAFAYRGDVYVFGEQYATHEAVVDLLHFPGRLPRGYVRDTPAGRGYAWYDSSYITPAQAEVMAGHLPANTRSLAVAMETATARTARLYREGSWLHRWIDSPEFQAIAAKNPRVGELLARPGGRFAFSRAYTNLVRDAETVPIGTTRQAVNDALTAERWAARGRLFTQPLPAPGWIMGGLRGMMWPLVVASMSVDLLQEQYDIQQRNADLPNLEMVGDQGSVNLRRQMRVLQERRNVLRNRIFTNAIDLPFWGIPDNTSDEQGDIWDLDQQIHRLDLVLHQVENTERVHAEENYRRYFRHEPPSQYRGRPEYVTLLRNLEGVDRLYTLALAGMATADVYGDMLGDFLNSLVPGLETNPQFSSITPDYFERQRRVARRLWAHQNSIPSSRFPSSWHMGSAALRTGPGGSLFADAVIQVVMDGLGFWQSYGKPELFRMLFSQNPGSGGVSVKTPPPFPGSGGGSLPTKNRPHHLFRGQDRRDMQKTVMALSLTLARDKKAIDPKPTAAISTRETVFDIVSEFPGPQREDAQAVVDLIKFKLALEITYSPATFFIDFTPGGMVMEIAVDDPGSYAGITDGACPLTIGDNGPGAGAKGVAWIAAGEVIWAYLTAYGDGYEEPFAEVG